MVLHKQGSTLFNGVRDLVAAHLDHQAESHIKPTFPALAPTSTTTTVSRPPPATADSKGKARAVQSPEPHSATITHTHHIALISGNPADRLTVIQAQERFLKAVRDVWDDHVACMKKLRDVLKYMVCPPRLSLSCAPTLISSRFYQDKVYTAAPGNNFDWMPPVWDLGLYIFLTHVIRSPTHPISTYLINAIITLITSERLGDTINTSVLRSATEMLTDLSNHSTDIIKRVDDRTGGNGGGPIGKSIYASDFEPLFLAESRAFYRDEGLRLLNCCDASEYLRKVISCFLSPKSFKKKN